MGASQSKKLNRKIKKHSNKHHLIGWSAERLHHGSFSSSFAATDWKQNKRQTRENLILGYHLEPDIGSPYTNYVIDAPFANRGAVGKRAQRFPYQQQQQQQQRPIQEAQLMPEPELSTCQKRRRRNYHNYHHLARHHRPLWLPHHADLAETRIQATDPTLAPSLYLPYSHQHQQQQQQQQHELSSQGQTTHYWQAQSKFDDLNHYYKPQKRPLKRSSALNSRNSKSSISLCPSEISSSITATTDGIARVLPEPNFARQSLYDLNHLQNSYNHHHQEAANKASSRYKTSSPEQADGNTANKANFRHQNNQSQLYYETKNQNGLAYTDDEGGNLDLEDLLQNKLYLLESEASAII